MGNRLLDLEKKFDRNIQVVFTDRDLAGFERYLLESILGDGKVLYGTIPPVPIQKLELEPFSIIKYDLRAIDHAKKM